LNGVYLAGTDSFFQGALVLFHDNLASAVTDIVIPLIGGSVFKMGNLEGANLAQSLCSGTAAKYSGRGQAKMYADNYKAGRTDQHQALQVGIEFAGQPYRDAEAMRAAGLYQRDHNQAKLENDFNYWVDGQVWRVKKLEILGNAIRALVGSHITKTEPYYRPNQAVAIAGGAIMGGIAGYMMLGATMGGPTGAAVGLIAGAALGALSSS
jgi:hypothetical protein